MIDGLRSVINRHRKDGFEIAFVGAAAKAMTVINAAAIQPDYFFDEAELKVGKFPPGMNVKIRNLKACADLCQPVLFVITAWNFSEEFLDKIKKIGYPTGSKFYVYFPAARFIEI